MKVCKKCKKQVANKTRICKFCGADVSKSKIIKNNNNKPQNKVKPKNEEKKKNAEEKKIIKKEQTVNKNQTQSKSKKIEKNNKTKVKEKTKKFKKDKQKNKTSNIKIKSNKIKIKLIPLYELLKKILINIKKISNSIKKIITPIMKKTWRRQKKVIITATKKIVKIIKRITIILSKQVVKITKQIGRLTKRVIINFHKLIIKTAKKLSKIIIKVAKAIKNGLKFIFKKIWLIIKKISLSTKKGFVKLFLIIKKVMSLILKYPVKGLRYLGNNLLNLIIIMIKKINPKPILIATIIICIFGGASCIFAAQYKKNSPVDNTKIITPEKATNEKLFSIGDIITYKGVDYQITKVETSEGNYYKQPKEGNIFLIIYISITNNTSEKIQYSYNNWTMSNSNDDEEKWVFTAVNMDSALYTGELAIGGVKKGSIIFEQPKDDKKLRLNFYDLKKDESGFETIDNTRKAFSVSIKIPKENNDENVKEQKAKETN